jgi:hypothetical protein
MQMRIYALYLLDKRIFVAMLSFWVLTSASSAAIIGWILSEVEGELIITLF